MNLRAKVVFLIGLPRLMRYAALAIVFPLSVSATVQASNIQLTYGGDTYNYNMCAGNYCSGGPYSLTATIDLAPGTNLLSLAQGTDIAADVTYFSMADGSGFVINSSSPALGDNFQLGTDAAGNILSWGFDVCTTPPYLLPGSSASAACLQTYFIPSYPQADDNTYWSDGSNQGECFSYGAGSLAVVQGSGCLGTVTQTTVGGSAPEPSGLILVGTGILGLLAVRYSARTLWTNWTAIDPSPVSLGGPETCVLLHDNDECPDPKIEIPALGGSMFFRRMTTAAGFRPSGLLNGLAIAWCLTLPMAFAQNDRSWVSSTGSDSNACTRIAPCATFAGALGNTNSGGEIDVVDPGGYGPVGIGQSVTIDGGGMGYILGNAFTDFAIWVTASNVTIRNLTLSQTVGAGNFYGIWAGPTSGIVNISNVQVSNFGAGVLAQGAGPVTIVDSRIQGNHFGVLLNLNNVNNVMIRNSIISGNNVAGVFVSPGTVTLDGVLVTNCGTGVSVGGNSAAGTVLLRNSTIMGNSTGLTALLGSIVSFVNNAIYNNGTNGAPTQSVFQK